jgi:predicted nuclease of predicted toxin-antitoxin system
VKWLIDECLHVSLVALAHGRGQVADHVNYLGLGSSKDWELMEIVIERDYTFVTNNRFDFLTLYKKEAFHAGLVVIVPNVTPARQRELFNAVLDHVGSRELINTVIEVNFVRQQVECVEYAHPTEGRASSAGRDQ